MSNTTFTLIIVLIYLFGRVKNNLYKYFLILFGWFVYVESESSQALAFVLQYYMISNSLQFLPIALHILLSGLPAGYLSLVLGSMVFH